ncbi:rhomboid family intramembrane serine protease [Deferribacter autotrophicus]|uniref:Rhomboid family intramembrane serine protease n=1 Tax=Deferribacter autotrophicus TaxID=500465 RepID=A0A5A8F8E2_9BACT|nr:rhomboid family intramembrane serine protease [Deferribacter autotrophicus]KAA0258433.1 rhomboid family intramembrane serine protease [Deferribacter autotrophicus]
MFPLKDSIPSSRTPIINYLIIIISVLVFIYEKNLGTKLSLFFVNYGVVPVKLFAPLHDVSLWEKIIPFFTSIFIHGGFFHLLFNMYFLYVFGDNVEDEFGHVKYFLFYIFCGLTAAITQVVMYPQSSIPMIGASGAIAGVMGSYFILFPQAKVKTLIFILFFITVIDVPAVVFLGLWFFIQFLNSMVQSTLDSAGGVAWWAHISGFVTGVIISIIYKIRKGY